MLLLLTVLACQDNALLFVPGEPSARITSHVDGDEAFSGSTVVLRGVVGHRDLGPESLRARWYLGEALACADAVPDADGTTTCQVALEAAGRVVLEARDPDNVVALDLVDLELVDNQPPRARFVAPEDGDEVESGDTLRLQGLVSDDEDAPTALRVRFKSSLDGVLDTGLVPDEDGIVSLDVTLGEGAHTLTLEVADTLGATDDDQVEVTVAVAGLDTVVEVDALTNCGSQAHAASVAEAVWVETPGAYLLTALGGAYTSWGGGEDATQWVWTASLVVDGEYSSFDPLDLEVFASAGDAEAAALGSLLTLDVPAPGFVLFYKEDHSCTDNYGTVSLSVEGPL